VLPVIWPVAAFSESPDGSAVPESDQTYGDRPPAALKTPVNAEPCIASPSVCVVIVRDSTTRIENARDACCPNAFVTRTVKGYVPWTDVDPEITPLALSANPGGSEPLIIVQLKVVRAVLFVVNVAE